MLNKINNIEKGTEVLIKVTILRRCADTRPENECGYVVKTSRGEVMVEPYDIFICIGGEK